MKSQHPEPKLAPPPLRRQNAQCLDWPLKDETSWLWCQLSLRCIAENVKKTNQECIDYMKAHSVDGNAFDVYLKCNII